MLRLLKNLLQRRPSVELPDLTDMPIADVWEEFVATVRQPNGRLAIEALRQPEFAAALAWLEPPTDCPLAKATMRAMVGAQRAGSISQLDEFAAVYQAEEGATDRRPPDQSIEALGQMCSLFRTAARVFYQTDPADKDSYVKIEITLEE